VVVGITFLLVLGAASVADSQSRSTSRAPATPAVRKLTAGPLELLRVVPDRSRDVAPGFIFTKLTRPARRVRMEVTAYCACPKCCGPQARGITASGQRVSYNGGRFVAADPDVLPMNTRVRVPGYHGAIPVKVIDTGGAIKGNKLDVYFPSHEVALQWGRQSLDIIVE